MARHRYTALAGVEVVIAANTPITVLQVLAPANIREAITGYSVAFDGTAGNAEPFIVEILRQTTAGTMTAGLKNSDDGLGSETIQATVTHTATAEPTAGAILRQYEIHPQTGAEWTLYIDRELLIPGSGRVGMRITSPAGSATVRCLPMFFMEE